MSDMPPDAVRPQARKTDWAADIAELIMASGQLPALKGRTYDCTVPAASNLKKHLASRAVPHMSQSQFCTLFHSASDASESPLRRDDARASIEVLHSLQRMANKLAGFEFSALPMDQSKVHLCGVEVSVRADLIAKTVVRNSDVFGAAVLRLTQDAADTESAKSKRRDMGLYVATLVKIHADQNLALPNPVANRACMSIDIKHGEAFQAPDSNTRRVADLENACRFIAAM